MKRYYQGLVILVTVVVLRVVAAKSVVSCETIKQEALQLMHNQSNALIAKDACAVGNYELKLNQLQVQQPRCFRNNIQLQATHKAYKFASTRECQPVAKRYRLLQAEIDRNRQLAARCNLGATILELKELINQHLKCLVTKQASPLIIDPSLNDKIDYR